MGALFPVKVYVPAFRQAITAEITFGFDEHKFPFSRGMKSFPLAMLFEADGSIDHKLIDKSIKNC
jgi:hypothetical protein